MILTIKSVKDSPGPGKTGKPWKIIHYDKDGEEKTKNIFLEAKYGLLVPGATIEITQVQEGKYWNVTDIKPATAQEAVKKDQSAEYATYNMGQSAKEESMAVSYIKDLRCAGMSIPLSLYATALVWISKKVGIESNIDDMEGWLISNDSQYKVKMEEKKK